MKKKIFGIALFILSVVCPAGIIAQVNNITIIPEPNSIKTQDGTFTLKKNTEVAYNADNLAEVLSSIQSGLSLDPKKQVKSTSTNKGNTIYLIIEDGFKDEEYKLEVTPEKIICKASTPKGLFYSVQSLLQLKKANNTIPCVVIEDQPLYSWRGFMLDEARHFRGKEVVKQYLDIMARLKLDVFHWHLTDEQAWRVEIKSYPKLTTVGSIGSWSDSKAPSAFYTQDEIREIVEYARQRFIMVVPEIDMPGHATAATRAYPELSGGGEGRWAGFTFNPAKESTYQFFDKVLTEIADLFPAPYIHIGADEVHFGNQSWFNDPEIQKFIKDNYLASEVGLEHYFVRRICEMINEKGKKMIGWDEIINTGVTPQKAIVMWWRHDKTSELTTALNKGFDVIMTPRIPCYFDFVQDDAHKIGRRWADGKFNRLETVYSFPENLNSLTEKKSSQILGLQANIWTERIIDKKRLDFMVFPRLLATAEDGWTKAENKNYTNFLDRVKAFLPYLDKLKVNYYNIFSPEKTPEPYGPDKEDVIAEG